MVFCIILGATINLTNFDLFILSPSIDISYAYIQNSLLLRTFTNPTLALTYGPLGFLVHALDIAYLRELLVVSYTFIGGATGFATYLYLRNWQNRYKYVAATLLLILIAIQVYEWKFLALYLLVLFYTYRQNSKSGLVILTLFSSTLLFVKLSLGLATILALVITVFLLRERIQKLYHLAVILVATVLLVGLLMFNSLTSLVAYFMNGLAVSSGYSSAMSLQPAGWLPSLAFIVGGGLVLIFTWWNLLGKRYRSLMLPLAAVLFFVWKAAVVRQDVYGHIESLLFLGVFITVLCTCIDQPGLKRASKRTWQILMVAAVAGTAMLAYGTYLSGYENKRLMTQFTNPLTFWRIETCQLSPCRGADILYLDDSLLTVIGDRTVDVYPWETTFVPANGLNWRSRPSPASYGTYTPKLDNLNAGFFSSSSAPQFILWDAREGISSIDGRHILHDEPATLSTILEKYRLVEVQGSQILLEKQPAKINAHKSKVLDKQAIAWEDWIEVPQSPGLVRAAIGYSPNIKQKIGDLWFRSEPVTMTVKKQDGQELVFRTVPKNLSQGIVINQLPTDAKELAMLLAGEQLGNPVVALKFNGRPTGTLSIEFFEQNL